MTSCRRNATTTKRKKTAKRHVLQIAVAIGVLTALSLTTTVTLVAQESKEVNKGLASVGKGLFRGYCRSCHGTEGRGDGPIAESLKVPPSDLTRLTSETGEFPLEKVVKRIDGRDKVAAHGSKDMPVWGDIFQKTEGGGTEEVVSHKVTALAHYLWSIQAGSPAGE